MRKDNRYDWLLETGTVLGFLKRFFAMMFILVLFATCFITFLRMFFYLFGMINLKEEANYILMSLKSFNLIISLILGIGIIIFIVLYIKSQIILIQIYKDKKNPNTIRIGSIRDDSQEKHLKSKIFFHIVSIILLGGLIFYFSNNYIAIYRTKIIIRNCIPFLEKEYDLDDVEKVELSVTDSRKGRISQYKLILKNNKKINISDGNIEELITLNKIIKAKGIKREIEDKYLESLVVYYQKSDQEKYRELFR